MSSTAEVLKLDDFRRRDDGTQTSSGTPSHGRVRIREGEGGRDPQSDPVETSLNDLYPADVGSDALIQRVRILLRECAEYAKTAKEALAEGDVVDGDQQTMLLLGRLPELFCCREVSEGLAALVVGLFHGLTNLHGEPLSLDQAYSISKRMSDIAERPFISFEEAADVLATFEADGLTINPSVAADLNYLILGEEGDE